MITGIHHVTFLSADLARARAFYEGVLGLQLDPERPSMSFDGVWYNISANQQIHLTREVLGDTSPEGIARQLGHQPSAASQKAACCFLHAAHHQWRDVL